MKTFLILMMLNFGFSLWAQDLKPCLTDDIVNDALPDWTRSIQDEDNRTFEGDLEISCLIEGKGQPGADHLNRFSVKLEQKVTGADPSPDIIISQVSGPFHPQYWTGPEHINEEQFIKQELTRVETAKLVSFDQFLSVTPKKYEVTEKQTSSELLVEKNLYFGNDDHFLLLIDQSQKISEGTEESKVVQQLGKVFYVEKLDQTDKRLYRVYVRLSTKALFPEEGRYRSHRKRITKELFRIFKAELREDLFVKLQNNL